MYCNKPQKLFARESYVTSFSGRVVVITGAGSGIGRALALSLAKEGAHLCLIGRTASKLEAVRREILAGRGKADAFPCDVSQKGEVETAYQKIQGTVGVPYALFLNAGIGEAGIVQNFNVEAARRVFDVNFFGVLNWMHYALPDLQKTNEGMIVAVSSLFAYKGFPGIAAYCASKAALMSFFESARVDLKATRIRLVTVFPLFVETDMSGYDASRSRWIWSSAEAAAEKILRQIQRGKNVVVFPRRFYALMLFLRGIPDGLYVRLWRWASPGT